MLEGAGGSLGIIEAGGDSEAVRLRALAEFDVLDTPSEQAFDDLAFIAAQTCGTPIALVSLLDRERQWFKARVGLDAPETPIDQSVCKQDIDRPGLLVIPDLTGDERTRDNPLVTGDDHLRFYAGAPLLADGGVAIGRLCVIDRMPRPGGLTEDQRKALGALARQVIVQLEQRRSVRRAAEVVRLQDCLIAVGDRIRESGSIAEMTYGTAEIVGRTLHADRAGFGTVDAATEVVTIESDWTAEGVAGIAGTHRFADFGRIRDELAAGEPLVIDDVDADPRTADDPAAMHALGISALVNMPVRQRGLTVAVFIVQSVGPRGWTEPELTFLRGVADRLETGVARFTAEQQQRTLNEEISHRLKNMLAMVQAIASQTLRPVVERAPIEAFERRLMALGKAHDVLMQSSWSSADLGDVLDAVLETFGYDGRIARAGPPVSLGARASLSFSLLIHELVTNAVKYGALSNPAGTVAIDWAFGQEDREPALVVRWRERGGPPVTKPERKGFGSKLIGLGLAGTGGVDLRYESLGLEADMTAKISHLALT